MIRFTPKFSLILVVGAVLAGCTSTQEPQTPPASTAVSTPAAETPKEQPAQKTAGVDLTFDWESADFSNVGAYSNREVTQAAHTIEGYIESAFANPKFLDGSWDANPTGQTLARELDRYFTQDRLDFITSLDPQSDDPNVLNDVNAVAFLVHSEGKTDAWKDPAKPATVKGSGLTFSEEPTTKTLKATFTVDITLPVRTTQGNSGQSIANYQVDAWLVPDGATMKIDGYSTTWSLSPYAG